MSIVHSSMFWIGCSRCFTAQSEPAVFRLNPPHPLDRVRGRTGASAHASRLHDVEHARSTGFEGPEVLPIMISRRYHSLGHNRTLGGGLILAHLPELSHDRRRGGCRAFNEK